MVVKQCRRGAVPSGVLALLPASRYLGTPLALCIDPRKAGCVTAQVLEYFPAGDLLSLLGDRQLFGLAQARQVLEHLAEAVLALHRRGLAHGDVKAENVCLRLTGSGRPEDDIPTLAFEAVLIDIDSVWVVSEESTRAMPASGGARGGCGWR